jgi:hypothetical protein
MTSGIGTSGVRSLSGKCLCGTVRYEVADQFLYSLNCHCSNCRRATGAAFKPFAGIERAKLRIPAAPIACSSMERSRLMMPTAVSADHCSIRSYERPSTYTLRWARWWIHRRFAPAHTSLWARRHLGTQSRTTCRNMKDSNREARLGLGSRTLAAQVVAPFARSSLGVVRFPPIRGIYRAAARLPDFAAVCMRGPTSIGRPGRPEVG